MGGKAPTKVGTTNKEMQKDIMAKSLVTKSFLNKEIFMLNQEKTG
jgi:hypothetical protein